MYTLTLTAHSWVRWLLVLAAAATCIRSGYALVYGKAYARVDRRLAAGLTGLLSLQLALGLLLYVVLSPVVRTALGDLGAAMGSSPLRFYVIEHQFAAFVAIGVGLWGLRRAGKAADDRRRHRAVAWGAGGCLLMILIAIPWPFLPYGRALFRL